MNEFVSYALNIILSLAIFFMAFKSCKDPKPEVKIVRDVTTINRLNQEYDSLEAHYFNATERYQKDINHFKELKSTVEYKYITKTKEVRDTIRECPESLDLANQVITHYDSLNSALERGLNSCNSHVKDLKRQLKFNREFKGVDIPTYKYKHLIGRVYWRKKNNSE